MWVAMCKSMDAAGDRQRNEDTNQEENVAIARGSLITEES
jgi:hypothetical protein